MAHSKLSLWWIAVPVVVLLAAAHGSALLLLRHSSLAAPLIAGVVLIGVLNHLGLLAFLFNRFRKRPRA